MKKKVFSLLFFSISLFLIALICYKLNNINVFTVDTIDLPQTEKFNVEVYKIDKIKVWEMKNVYLYNGDYFLKMNKGDKKLLNRFYMVNKQVQNVDSFFNKFIKITDLEECGDDEYFIAYYFYLESKKLPKYWMPVWERFCQDELTQHEDDLLFIITTDAHKNILNIDIPFLKK